MTASDSFKSRVEISVRTPIQFDFGLKQQHYDLQATVGTHTLTRKLLLMDSREEIAHTPIQPHTKAASSFSSQSALLYEIE